MPRARNCGVAVRPARRPPAPAMDAVSIKAPRKTICSRASTRWHRLRQPRTPAALHGGRKPEPARQPARRAREEPVPARQEKAHLAGVCLEDRDVDLKALKRRAGRPGSLSFGSPELLMEVPGRGSRRGHAVRRDQRHRAAGSPWCWTKACWRSTASMPTPCATTARSIAGRRPVGFLADEGYDPVMIDFARPLDAAGDAAALARARRGDAI